MFSDLLPISALTLYPNFPVGVDILLRQSSQTKPVLLLSASQSLDAESIKKLFDDRETRLFIRKGAREAYQEYLREHADEWLHSDALPPIGKAAVLAEVVRGVLLDAFNNSQTDTIIDAVKTCGDHISGLIANVALDGTELTRILHHDFGTFTHSANVALYASLLARELKFNEAEICELSIGTLLHDIGKLDIEDRILNKPGKLNEAEFRVIKTHPAYGFRRLCSRDDITESQLLITYQHHERLDGRGYPVGIPGNLIHPWAKICTVVDVFEAITSNRPYRKAMTHAMAFKIMSPDVGTAFDQEIYECWKSVIHKRTST